MAGRPGDGCDDPRETHPHWCGRCGARQMFAALECAQLMTVPACPRCGGTDWRDEVDELTAPDHRDGGERA
jgi:ribosomal protein S27AE